MSSLFIFDIPLKFIKYFDVSLKYIFLCCKHILKNIRGIIVSNIFPIYFGLRVNYFLSFFVFINKKLLFAIIF